VVGHFCSYVPEELVHAAGAVPYRMRAVGSTGTALGDTYFSSANCSFVRRVMDLGLRGGFDFLAGIIFMNGCDHNRRLFDNWSYAKPATGFSHLLFVPHASSPACLAQYRTGLDRLARVLEGHLGTTITDDRLRASIELYDRRRVLLRALAERRRAQDPPLSGTEFLATTLAVTALPPEDAVDLLERALAEVEAGRVHRPRAALRLFVTGSCLEELSHLELLESAGTVVVADAICLGSRLFDRAVDAGAADPLDALAARYLRHLSCPRMMDDVAGRVARVVESVRDWSADAVVLEKLEFCSMMSGESYILSRELAKARIPCLALTRELYGGGTGQLKTRLQAFCEQVRGRP
jgi:benzoyl-CoA reductase/2-hydroxyglutaryl-CoA dehydratase subunit BcrC/BadD/HgdB